MEDEETDRSPAGRVSVEERGIQEERGLAPTVLSPLGEIKRWEELE